MVIWYLHRMTTLLRSELNVVMTFTHKWIGAPVITSCVTIYFFKCSWSYKGGRMGVKRKKTCKKVWSLRRILKSVAGVHIMLLVGVQWMQYRNWSKTIKVHQVYKCMPIVPPFSDGFTCLCSLFFFPKGLGRSERGTHCQFSGSSWAVIFSGVEHHWPWYYLLGWRGLLSDEMENIKNPTHQTTNT